MRQLRRLTSGESPARRQLGIGALLLVFVSAACAPSSGRADDSNEELLVFAAASLRDVFADLEPRWSEAHPGIKLVGAFDGSNVLATQIAEGAPADVLLSADTAQPERLLAAGLGVGPAATFAGNRITLVASLAEGGIDQAAELADPGVRIVAAGSGVPITGYAESLLEQISAAMADPTSFRQRVDANVVSREDNVRAALAKVELAEGDAAFVYRTDALTSDLVREVELPSGIGVEADYAALQISETQAAAAFVAWLGGPQAGEVLEAAGFRAVAR